MRVRVRCVCGVCVYTSPGALGEADPLEVKLYAGCKLPDVSAETQVLCKRSLCSLQTDPGMPPADAFLVEPGLDSEVLQNGRGLHGLLEIVVGYPSKKTLQTWV